MRSRAVAEANAVIAFKKPMRIVVVDDHIFMRDLITARLNREETRYVVVASVGNAAEAIEACKKFVPDLLILDVNLPDQNGIEIVPATYRDHLAGNPCAVVHRVSDRRSPDRCVPRGREGFRGKDKHVGRFSRRGRTGRSGRTIFFFEKQRRETVLARNARRRKRRYIGAPLSPRELEVFRLIALGSTSKEIASKLFISAATVETHRTNLMSKLGVRNVAGLILYGFQHGLLEMPEFA